MAEKGKTLMFKNDETGVRFAVNEGSLAHQRMTRAGAPFSRVKSMEGGPQTRALSRAPGEGRRR